VMLSEAWIAPIFCPLLNPQVEKGRTWNEQRGVVVGMSRDATPFRCSME
jgi:hypothetical protein